MKRFHHRKTKALSSDRRASTRELPFRVSARPLCRGRRQLKAMKSISPISLYNDVGQGSRFNAVMLVLILNLVLRKAHNS